MTLQQIGWGVVIGVVLAGCAGGPPAERPSPRSAVPTVDAGAQPALRPMAPEVSPAADAEAPPSQPVQQAPVEPAPDDSSPGASEQSDVSNMARVVAGLRPLLLRCYKRSLERHGAPVSGLNATVELDKAGRVRSVKLRAAGQVPKGLESCLKRVIGAAVFDPPAGGSAVLTIPIASDAQ